MAHFRFRGCHIRCLTAEMTIEREDHNMIVKANSLWISMILLVALCLPHPVFAESDLESLKKEIAGQREKLAEQTRKLEEMEKRLDEAMETSRSPAGGTSAETGTTQVTDSDAGKTKERSERIEPRDSVAILMRRASRPVNSRGRLKFREPAMCLWPSAVLSRPWPSSIPMRRTWGPIFCPPRLARGDPIRTAPFPWMPP